MAKAPAHWATIDNGSAPAIAVLAVKVEPLRASLTRTLTAPRGDGP
jgi:hypothetical protein